MTTATKTDPSTLPQYEGRAVPWITRWTGEVSHEPYGYNQQPGRRLTVGYPDGKENREGNGLLWMREGLGRGGRPMWADVNTYRQRAAMARCKCQVCGSTINARPVLWLMPTVETMMIEEDGTLKTTTAPTCEACIPLALELCPALPKMGWTICKVLEYEVWGALAELVIPNGDGSIRRIPPTDVGYDNPALLPHAVARQQIVKFTKFAMGDSGGGKP